MDFETLINDCFDSLRKSIEAEERYKNSSEGIREELKESEQEFTKNGSLFNY
jgi:Arc/MetJ-type ribon-helix-helix transcriptional regulator